LALSFGVWNRDRKLMAQGAMAIAVSTGLAIVAGAIVAWIEGGPIRFSGFKSPLASLALSVVIGITAGVSTADDTGRRYLIGVAAAVQLAVIPVWLGAALALGLPDRSIVYARLATFALNLIGIASTALAAYAVLHLGGRWRSTPLGRL
jgi:uncharacterized membrane protein